MTVKRSTRTTLALCGVLASGLSACSGSGTDQDAAADDGTVTVGFSVYDMQYDYFKKMAQGTQAAAEAAGYEFVVHDEKSDEAEMIAGLEKMLDDGVDVLIISPFKPEALGPIITKAQQRSVPVIIDDIGGGGTTYDSIVISDNAGGGQQAAEHMAAQIRANGVLSNKVVSITCEPSAIYAARRNEGFRAGIEAAGGVVVVEQSGNSKPDDAYAIMQAALAAHPDIVGVFACNDPMAVAAAKAVAEAGLDPVRDVVTIGFNGDPDAVTAIGAGGLSATVAQDPAKMGAMTVELATQALAGDIPDYDNAEDREVHAPVTLVTPQNAGQFAG